MNHQLRKQAQDFAGSHCNQDLPQLDRDERFNAAGWAACAEYGLFRHRIPEVFGGTERPLTEQLEILQGFGEGCEDNGLLLAFGAQVWACSSALQTFASPELKNALLPRLAQGELIVSHAVSEPAHGSDIAQMQTRAKKTGGAYLLDGVKTWVTNAPIADVHIVFARTEEGTGSRGLSAFVVDGNSPGLQVETISKMGLRTAQMGLLKLDNVEVPASRLLGEIGQGFSIVQHSLAWERAFILAPMLGTMARLMKRCIAYARSRHQFGRSIGEFDAVSSAIVQMRLRIETGRTLLADIATQAAAGRMFHDRAALLKFHLSESWYQTCADALHLHGARGYTCAESFERELRDAVGSRIFSGTSAIQQRIVAQFMGVCR